MKLICDSPEDVFWYNSTSSIQRCAPIFRNSKCYSKFFFWKSELSTIRYNSSRFHHIWRYFQLVVFQSCQFWLKFDVKSRSKFQQFKDRWKMHFFLRMIQDCLECVHQLKESIPKCSFRECQRKRSHFDRALSWPF